MGRAAATLGRKLAETVAENEMPPVMYVLAHPGARLSGPERTALIEWARTIGGGERDRRRGDP